MHHDPSYNPCLQLAIRQTDDGTLQARSTRFTAVGKVVLIARREDPDYDLGTYSSTQWQFRLGWQSKITATTRSTCATVGRERLFRARVIEETSLYGDPREGVFDATVPVQHVLSTIPIDTPVIHPSHYSYTRSSQEGARS
jgi:hypothetical protein